MKKTNNPTIYAAICVNGSPRHHFNAPAVNGRPSEVFARDIAAKALLSSVAHPSYMVTVEYYLGKTFLYSI